MKKFITLKNEYLISRDIDIVCNEIKKYKNYIISNIKNPNGILPYIEIPLSIDNIIVIEGKIELLEIFLKKIQERCKNESDFNG